MIELTLLAQHWLAFSLVFGAQLLLVLVLRKPIRARFGAVACYRLWLLPIAWLPLYFLGPMLFAALVTPHAVDGMAGSATPYQQALQQFVAIELLPFDLNDVGSTTIAVDGDSTFTGWSVLALVWAAGTIALIFWHGRRWLNFSRVVHALSAPVSAVEKERLGTTAHFAPKVPVLHMEGMNSAALFGVVKPALLLPENFGERYDSNQRHIILAHEAVHLRRGDNGWNLCALLLIACCWTNPLVFVAWRHFRLDQELSCDALALRRCNKEQQKRYARTLLDSLSTLSKHANQPALSNWDNLREIKERSLMINKHVQLTKRPLATLFSLLSLAVLGGSLTVAFAELVSPVAKAAESTQQVQPAQSVMREVQPATQATPTQAAQEVQQAVTQAPRQVAQAAQQPVTQTPVQEVAQPQSQQVQRAEQETQRAAQDSQQALQGTQRAVQESAQALQKTQRALQESQKALKETQDALQRTQQEQQKAASVRPVSYKAPSHAKRGGNSRIGVERSGEGIRAIDQQTGNVFIKVIAALDNAQYTEARDRLAKLSIERLNSYERSRYEQLMYKLELVDKNYPQARAHLQAAIDSGGLYQRERASVDYSSAQLFMQEKQYEAGAAALEAWIAAQPEPVGDAHYLLAAAYYYQERFAEALPHAQKAVELGGKAPQEGWLSMLASLYIEERQFVAAESVVSKMVERFPSNEAYQRQLAGLQELNAQ